jgi:hypothetical protein
MTRFHPSGLAEAGYSDPSGLIEAGYGEPSGLRLQRTIRQEIGYSENL